MKFIKKLFVLSIFALSLVLTGCLNFDNVKTLEFVQAPQSIYYLVGVDQAMDAQEEVLKDVTVKINGNVYTLFDAISQSLIQYEGLDLTTEGTKTLIVTLRDDPNVRLTYVYKVVDGLAYELFAGGKGTKSDPYKIETPQQFMNMATKVYGTPTPSTSVESDWETYYNAVMPYFTNGVFFEITKDLDFSGVSFYPLGVLGGPSFVPFTGTIEGKGHKIKNLTIIAKDDFAAVFAGLNGATIKNLTFENVNAINYNRYASILFNEAARNTTQDTNLIYNIKITSGMVVAPRAAAFTTEASNSIFVKCEVGVDFTVIGYDTNSGLMIGAVLTRSYDYSKAVHTSSSSSINNTNTLTDLLTDRLTVAELNTVQIPEFTAVSAVIIDCKADGKMIGEPNNYKPDYMTGTRDLKLAVFNSTFSNNKSIGEETSNFELYFSFTPKDAIPHQTVSIKSVNNLPSLSLKYDTNGNVRDTAGFDNSGYLIFDIYGNPVQSSKYYFTLVTEKSVSVIKVSKDANGVIVGVKKLAAITASSEYVAG